MKTFCFISTFLLSACTISMQNISTHGTASDVVDENQKADAQIDAQIPLAGL